MTQDERENLRRRLAWCYNGEEAHLRITGQSPQAQADLRKWKNLGKPQEERE